MHRHIEVGLHRREAHWHPCTHGIHGSIPGPLGAAGLAIVCKCYRFLPGIVSLHLTFIFYFSTCFIIFHHISVQDALLFDLAKPTVQPLLVRVTLHHSTRPVGSWIISHEFSSLVHNGTCVGMHRDA